MKTYEKLFTILSQADDYVNGESLAHKLGISRTSIWKAIQRLEKEGIQIDSVKNRGYKLKAGDLLIPEIIENMREDDLLMITADHGNDPTYAGTDHTREYIPVLAISKSLKHPTHLPRSCYMDFAKG